MNKWLGGQRVFRLNLGVLGLSLLTEIPAQYTLAKLGFGERAWTHIFSAAFPAFVAFVVRSQKVSTTFLFIGGVQTILNWRQAYEFATGTGRAWDQKILLPGEPFFLLVPLLVFVVFLLLVLIAMIARLLDRPGTP